MRVLRYSVPRTSMRPRLRVRRAGESFPLGQIWRFSSTSLPASELEFPKVTVFYELPAPVLPRTPCLPSISFRRPSCCSAISAPLPRAFQPTSTVCSVGVQRKLRRYAADQSSDPCFQFFKSLSLSDISIGQSLLRSTQSFSSTRSSGPVLLHLRNYAQPASLQSDIFQPTK